MNLQKIIELARPYNVIGDQVKQGKNFRRHEWDADRPSLFILEDGSLIDVPIFATDGDGFVWYVADVMANDWELEV